MKKIFSRLDATKTTEQFSYKSDIINILARNIGDGFWEYRERFERAVSFQEELSFPIHIDFETIFGCNLQCIMCTHAHKDLFPSRQPLMEFELFTKIIDEGIQYGLSSIGLDQEGDPLLVNNLNDFIAYAKRKGILDIIINTNALLLDIDKTEELLNSELTRIHFSLDSINEDTYNQIRVGSDFKKVIENILYFCKRKKELKKELPITRVSFVKMKCNEGEMESFISFWTPHVDAIAIQEYNNPFPEYLELNKLYANSRVKNDTFRCTQPWFRIVVLSDGSVLPCCLLGMSLKMAIGNANNETIYNLWNSESMKRLRQLHKEKKYFQHSVCRLCVANFI